MDHALHEPKPNYAFMFIQWNEIVVVNGQLDIKNMR